MIFRNLHKQELKEIVNKLLIYGLIVYVVFILGRSIWDNFQLKRQIDSNKNQISDLQNENKNLENLIVYYQSDSFKEMEARSKLGLKKPGETAVSVPTKKYSNFQTETEAEKKNIAPPTVDQTVSNWRSWWEYFSK